MKSLTEIPLGSIVYETVEKYEAMVVRAQIHLNGCHRVCLQEKRIGKDGEPTKIESCDIQTLSMVKINEGGAIAQQDDVLGLLAVDSATGYEGTITIVDTDISGRVMYSLQSSKRNEAGERVKPQWCYKETLALLEPRRDSKREVAEARTGNSKEPAFRT